MTSHTQFSSMLLSSGIIFLLCVVTPLPATLIISYDASEVSNNPVDQGWIVSGNYGDAPLPYPPAAGQETIGSRNWNYWNVANPNGSANNSYSAMYRANLNASDFSDPQGWTATATLRVESSFTTWNSTWMEISDGQNLWIISFVRNATPVSYVSYRTLEDNLTVLSTFDLSEDYFTIQMYWSPDSETMSYFLNGGLVAESVGRSDVQTGTQYYIRWGDNDGSPRSYRTIGHWNAVRLESGYHVIPEVGSISLILAGGGLWVLLIGRHIRKLRIQNDR